MIPATCSLNGALWFFFVGVGSLGGFWGGICIAAFDFMLDKSGVILIES